jgi:hypothetical protein
MKNAMDNTLTPIEDLILSGLAERFFKVFGVPLLFYNGPDVKTVAAQMLQKKGLPQYPFAHARTTNWEVTENSYKPNTMLRRGLRGRSSNDYVLAYQLNLTPVTTTYEVTFYVQSFREVNALARTWLLNAVRNSLNTTIEYGVGGLDVNVSMDRNITTPNREGGTTEVKEYQMVTTMRSNGWMGEQIKTSQAVTTLEFQVGVMAENGLKGAIVSTFGDMWADPSVQSSVDLSTATINDADAAFVHTQTVQSTAWLVEHNLDRYPVVTVLDQSNNLISATVNYASTNKLLLTFKQMRKGKALCV